MVKQESELAWEAWFIQGREETSKFGIGGSFGRHSSRYANVGNG